MNAPKNRTKFIRLMEHTLEQASLIAMRSMRSGDSTEDWYIDGNYFVFETFMDDIIRVHIKQVFPKPEDEKKIETNDCAYTTEKCACVKDETVVCCVPPRLRG